MIPPDPSLPPFPYDLSRPVPPDWPSGTGDQRLVSIRKRLETVFQRLALILDVTITVHKAIESQGVEHDDNFARVLQRSGCDKLHVTLVKLNKIIEELGGKTSYSDDAPNLTEQINDHVDVVEDDDEEEEDELEGSNS